MMLCHALSVLLLVISTVVIGQPRGYYLANCLGVCYFNSWVLVQKIIVFSIAFGQILSCSYYTIHSWLYQLTVMVSSNYILAPKLLAVHTLELAFSDQLWVM